MNFVQSLAGTKRAVHKVLLQRLGTRTRRPFQQLLALKVIFREEVRTQSALAERLMVDRPAASRLVDKLEQDGLLVRHPCTDRRCVALSTTAAAKPEVKAFEDALEWLDEEIRKRVPASKLSAAIAVMESLQGSLGDLLDSDEDAVNQASGPRRRGGR